MRPSPRLRPVHLAPAALGTCGSQSNGANEPTTVPFSPSPTMCARYTLFTPAGALAERFRLAQVPDLVARYNVSPSQLVPVVGAKAAEQGRGLAMF